MIPEIYERFCAINFLRQRKSVCEDIFWGGQKDQIETIIYFLDNSIIITMVNMTNDHFAKIKKYTRLINKHLTNTGNRVIIVLKEKI